MYSVIIPNRFQDVIQPLLDSLSKYESDARVVIIADNHKRSYGHQIIPVRGEFNYSKSINTGLRYTYPSDVILLNDDVTLLSETFDELCSLAHKDHNIGILTPLVDGGCGNLFMRPSHVELWQPGRKSVRDNFHYCCCRSGDCVTFACVYIKRWVFDRIGTLDERFIHYGFEDTDFCRRARKAGIDVAVTNKLTVRHGDGGEVFVRGKNWSKSFIRVENRFSKDNLQLLQSKHPEMTRSNGNH